MRSAPGLGAQHHALALNLAWTAAAHAAKATATNI